MKKRNGLQREFFRKNRLMFCVVIGVSALVAGLNLVLSVLLQQALDLASGVSTIWTLPQLIVISILVLVGVLAAGIGTCLAKPRFLRRAMQQYKEAAFRELAKKGTAAFSKENTSLYLSALSNDANSIETNYLEKLFDCVVQLLLFAGAIALMLWYNPFLTLVAALFSALPVIAAVLTGGKLAPAEQKVSQKNESFVAALRDCLSGFPVIKSMKAEQQAFRLFSESCRSAEQAKARRRGLNTVISTISSISGAAAQLGVILTSAAMAAAGFITPGVVMIFVQLMGFILEPISVLPEFLANRKAALALVKKLEDALAIRTPDGGTEIPPVLRDAVELRDVSFSYVEGEPVLNHLSVRLEAGKSYAIVGTSGSGKSTLLSLLMASSPTYTGEILVDGVELREIRLSSLYDLMSLIRQDVFLFQRSLRDNLTMFRDFPEEVVRQAASLAGLGDLVAERGLDFPCGENGNALSGGERQRVSIARSLLRKTPVLLADEATAALDRETAFRVTSSLLDLDGLTRVVVTHSLDEPLLRRFDEILVLRGGVIEERGAFDSLMARKSCFYSLMQARLSLDASRASGGQARRPAR